MMQVTVNGEPRTVPDGATVGTLLASLGVTGKAIAVEQNRRIVPRGRHADCTLREGDRLEIVTLVGGG
jgi:sulfur carrier protein